MIAGKSFMFEETRKKQKVRQTAKDRLLKKIRSVKEINERERR